MKKSLLLLVSCLAILAFQSVANAATLAVTTELDELTDNSVCSLREAITTANNDNAGTLGVQRFDECAGSETSFGDDTIVLPAGTYTLSLTGADEDSNATGDLNVRDNLTVTGAGPTQTFVDGFDADRVFNLINASALTISGVTIQNGVVEGDGGGIYCDNNTTLNLSQSAVSSGSSTTSAGGIYLHTATATLTDVTISENDVTNTSGEDIYGGGIFADQNSTLTVTNSTISNNTMSSEGYTYGGGLYVETGSATITSSTITLNSLSSSDGSAAFGGGIFASNAATLTIEKSTLSYNSALSDQGVTAGGGMAVGSFVLPTDNSVVTITNSTVSNNMSLCADSSGCGNTYGGGLYFYDTVTANLNNLTISENVLENPSASSTVEFGGGLYAAASSVASDVNIKNTIIANNTSDVDPDASGNIDSYGGNVIATLSDNLVLTAVEGVDVTDEDPLLNAFAAYGGDTLTYSLTQSSPAIDIADCFTIDGTALTTDQTGADRPDSYCDSGTYEFPIDCGDGSKQAAEACDDGNTNSEDGCSSTCTIENDNDGDGYYAEYTDCDDTDASVSPASTEICGDDADNDCNTAADCDDLVCSSVCVDDTQDETEDDTIDDAASDANSNAASSGGSGGGCTLVTGRNTGGSDQAVALVFLALTSSFAFYRQSIKRS